MNLVLASILSRRLRGLEQFAPVAELNGSTMAATFLDAFPEMERINAAAAAGPFIEAEFTAPVSKLNGFLGSLMCKFGLETVAGPPL